VEHAIVNHRPIILHKRELCKGSIDHEHRCCKQAGEEETLKGGSLSVHVVDNIEKIVSSVN